MTKNGRESGSKRRNVRISPANVGWSAHIQLELAPADTHKPHRIFQVRCIYNRVTKRQNPEGQSTTVSAKHTEPLGTLWIDAAGAAHFESATHAPDDPLDLAFVRRVLGISDEQLADLFGIRRASLVGWRKHGIPLNRRASVARLVELARVLARDVREERLPEIVRTPDEWLGGKSILQTIAGAGVEPVFAYLHRLFSYA